MAMEPASCGPKKQAIWRPPQDLVKKGDVTANVEVKAGRRPDHPAKLVLIDRHPLIPIGFV